MLEARKLPEEGPLKDGQCDAVRAAILAYMHEHAISFSDVGKQVGLAGNTVNQILNGQYGKVGKGKLDGHLRDLNTWLEGDARRRCTKPKVQFVETLVAKRLLGAAAKIHRLQTMGCAHGPSGIGKTMVAHVIAERFPASIYLRISKGNNSYTGLRRMLAQRLNLFARRRAAETPGLGLDERIFDRLRGSGRLLLIDEAHKLGDSALEFLRDVFDECEVPIMLLCTKDLIGRIRRDNDQDHGQLYSRFGFICDLTRGRDKIPGGNRPLFSLDEIRKLFAGDTVRFTPGGEQFLQDVANTLGQGSLRRCGYIMRWAAPIARKRKNLPAGSRVLIDEAVLRKAEREPMDDAEMLDDITSRAMTPVTARAAG